MTAMLLPSTAALSHSQGAEASAGAIPQHSMSVSSLSIRAQHFQCHAVKLVLFQKRLLFAREDPPASLVC